MKKLPPHMRGAKNVPYVKISLGREELNALIHALEENKSMFDGDLVDSVVDLQLKVLNTARYKPENPKKNQGEVVSLEFWGDEITSMLQQFVATSLSQVEKMEDSEDVLDFFESVKTEHLEKKSKDKN